MIPTIDAVKLTDRITSFLKGSFAQAGFTDAVIAVSGGVDSATSFALAVRALGGERVYPILLPYGALNTQGVLDAMSLVEKLKIPFSHVIRIDIKPTVDTFFGKEIGIDNLRKGNIMARVRMVYIFDQAKKRNALVVGTENKSEHYLGYFTRFGDQASDIEPLRNLYKTQVYDLAKYLDVPEPILTKKPTAGLWEGQTDEGEFGFSYKDADEILYRYFDKKELKESIVKAGLDAALVENVLGFVRKNDFKHRLPLIPPDNE